MSGEFLTLNLAANDAKQFAKAGRYFEVISDGGNGGTFDVQFYGPQGNIVSTWKGVVSGFFTKDPWTSFQVTNGGVAQSVTLMLLDSGEGGSRRQPGVVSVVDQGVSKTNAGNQFLQSITCAASAGLGSLAFVVASATKKLVIKGVSVQSGAAGLVIIGYGTGGGTVASLAAGNLNTKLIGGAVSTALQGSQTIAGLFPTGTEVTGSGRIAGVYVPANQNTQVPLTTPIVLQPGQVFWCASNALNRDVSMILDCEEI